MAGCEALTTAHLPSGTAGGPHGGIVSITTSVGDIAILDVGIPQKNQPIMA